MLIFKHIKLRSHTSCQLCFSGYDMYYRYICMVSNSISRAVYPGANEYLTPAFLFLYYSSTSIGTEVAICTPNPLPMLPANQKLISHVFFFFCHRCVALKNKTKNVERQYRKPVSSFRRLGLRLIKSPRLRRPPGIHRAGELWDWPGCFAFCIVAQNDGSEISVSPPDLYKKLFLPFHVAFLSALCFRFLPVLFFLLISREKWERYAGPLN